jgi:plasmid maintenance system antidote protein VapI
MPTSHLQGHVKLDVGRPDHSQLLNGNAAPSPEMAMRFGRAFGVKMDTLLKMHGTCGPAPTKSTSNHTRPRRAETASDVKVVSPRQATLFFHHRRRAAVQHLEHRLARAAKPGAL